MAWMLSLKDVRILTMSFKRLVPMGRWLLRDPEGCQAEESQHGLIFCVELDDLIEYVSPEKQCHEDNSSDSSTGVKNRICLF